MGHPDNQIWQVTTKMPHGQLQAYRSTKIGDAIRLDRDDETIQVAVADETDPTKKHTYQKTGKQIFNGVLAIWMQFLMDHFLFEKGQDVFLLVPGAKKGLVFDVWALITSFSIGDNSRDIFLPLNTVGHYALCLKDLSKTPGIFPIIFHPDVLVQAVLHGDESMVRNILKTKPDLLQIGEGVDFSGRQFCRAKGSALTAIQAAISAGDFSPNQNSTGLCELLVEKLQQQRPDDWKHIAHDQVLILYKKSLCIYTQKQEKRILELEDKKSAGMTIDENALNTAKLRLQAYLTALRSNDLAQIIHAHTNPDPDPTKTETLDAQNDHAISVDQALIDAIANASDAEIQAVLDDPTIDLPLSNLIKQFRIDVDSICQSEIIANPQHLLKLSVLYDVFEDRVCAFDPNFKKRELFWCHLVGHVQRYLPAGDAQIFANPSLYYVVRQAAKNARLFDFRDGGDSIFPLSYDSNSGLGYKFAIWRPAISHGALRGAPHGWLAGRDERGGLLQNLCLTKIASFQNLLRGKKRHRPAP